VTTLAEQCPLGTLLLSARYAQCQCPAAADGPPWRPKTAAAAPPAQVPAHDDVVLTASLRARFLPICPAWHGPDDRLPPARRPGVRADQRAGSLRAVVRPGPELAKDRSESRTTVARGLTSESDSGCEWPTAAQKLMASAVPRPTAHPQAAQPNHMWSKKHRSAIRRQASVVLYKFRHSTP
jgi:hypothetical protein